ncbi:MULTISPECIES: CD225/dispanin family protein [unclassified Prevotella]|jgi:interferon-induced transmembrane protein|uniref:CD225/dispanin family protein n=1 Tax=unclassified Prevotella TaxID=2638335 RepID=UPI00025BA10C|nr:CD225/dispanin family protein [Prevotella sp. oral taxon 306]EID33548.1 interferon-induced transmembrane protein [Prevotella sp. oral taxon 306 str. F0472]
MEELNNPKPNNYLPLAIFTTLCCCLPFGIYAIIRSMKVNDYYMMKQYDAAAAAAADAKKWSIIGIVTGVIFQIIYFGFLGGMSYLSALSH